ncbi:hypothetical protein GWN28_01540 [candidate division KSB1 bacterium]|nr:hypothetical protein [candidate division KSB1 bacterium]NIS22729.1 hypothetical protein [candidate division KSB1 bacterium]NIU90395.1 hypothetical protein [candidate division KSB1 bacterium]NIW17095.1 hypothetical protein [candidate division KSB1 bacterium]
MCRNRKSRTLAGASLGFLGGAIAGAMIGYAADEQGNDVAPEHAALLGAAPGAGLGVLIGAGIGSAMADERWQEVPLAEIRMNMTPNGHEGFAVFKSLAH